MAAAGARACRYRFPEIGGRHPGVAIPRRPLPPSAIYERPLPLLEGHMRGQSRMSVGVAAILLALSSAPLRVWADSESAQTTAPVDRNLPAPDAEEPAEIDYGGTGLTGTVDDNVNDAAHVFIHNATDFPAEDRLYRQRVKDCR